MSWSEAKWVVDQLLQKTGKAPNNMRSLSAFATSKNSVGLTFSEPEDSYDTAHNLLCSVGGVVIRMSADHFPVSPSDGDLVIDNKNLGAYAETPFIINDLEEGQTYYFSAFPYSTQGVFNLSPNALNRTEGVPLDGEYVTVEITIDDTANFTFAEVTCVDETDDTETQTINLTAAKRSHIFTVSIGHTYHIEYSNVPKYSTPERTASKVSVAGESTTYIGAYEIYHVYGISRTIANSSTAWARTDDAVGITAPTASVGTTAGQSEFDNIYPWSEMQRVTFNGANGLPNTGDVMVYIPPFCYKRWVENGVEHIQIADKPSVVGFTKHPGSGTYIGAYETSGNNKSVTGVNPTVSQTRATMRTNARAKGTGWSLVDVAAQSAVQMLYLVEFADNNVQTKIGRGKCDDTWDNRFAGLATGTCDSLLSVYYTGRETENGRTDGHSCVMYRGIENWWGNCWEWFDGLNVQDGKYFICTDPSKYADDTSANYTQLGYVGAANWSQSYITTEGYDENAPWAMLPSAAGSGSDSTYYCDAVWSSTGWRTPLRSGGWFHASAVGIFALYVSNDSSYSRANVGSRLLYKSS